MLRRLYHRLRAQARTGKGEREMDAEMRFHLDMETAREHAAGDERRRSSAGGVAQLRGRGAGEGGVSGPQPLPLDRRGQAGRARQLAIVTEASRFSGGGGINVVAGNWSEHCGLYGHQWRINTLAALSRSIAIGSAQSGPISVWRILFQSRAHSVGKIR